MFGPMGYDEAWQLISQNYRAVEWSAIASAEGYCEELITRANLPEFGPKACEFIGVSVGFNDILIDGMVLDFPRDYTNMVWIEPDVMQHKNGPQLVDCYSDPPVGNIEEDVFIYETSQGGVRVILVSSDICVG